MGTMANPEHNEPQTRKPTRFRVWVYSSLWSRLSEFGGSALNPTSRARATLLHPQPKVCAEATLPLPLSPSTPLSERAVSEVRVREPKVFPESASILGLSGHPNTYKR